MKINWAMGIAGAFGFVVNLLVAMATSLIPYSDWLYYSISISLPISLLLMGAALVRSARPQNSKL